MHEALFLDMGYRDKCLCILEKVGQDIYTYIIRNIVNNYI